MNQITDKLATLEQDIANIISLATGTAIDRSIDTLEHLNLDSLTKLEIMTMLEKKFSLALTEDVVNQFTSISRIARIIHRTVEAHSSGK